MANITVSIINASGVLSDDEVRAAVPAFQTQVQRDFGPAWGLDAQVTFVATGEEPAPGSWWLVILDNSDQAGALGYHDLTKEGLPLGKVFAATDLAYRHKWTHTLSHELLEILADPDINLTVFVQADSSHGVLYSREVCDACQAEAYGYEIDGVFVSDFVYPAWFESFWGEDGTQFDYGKQIRRPFQLLGGGYISMFDMSSGTGWQQLKPADRLDATDLHAVRACIMAPTEHRFEERPRIGSRRERRRLPRNQWIKSTATAAVRQRELAKA
ncbi:MAG: hypothetical protein M3003_12130 [Candidatus Dormibacteraeota bacterium]|nr:hypothetical protein [Candidatus Dormibacteraeota bacterium]